MLGKLSFRLAKYALKHAELTVEERNLYTDFILDKINAFPLRAIISSSEAGEILINGKPIDANKAVVLRDRAISALDNEALQLCFDQVRWLAFKEGMATGLPPEGLLFYRAALWFCDQTKAHLKTFAQQEQERAL